MGFLSTLSAQYGLAGTLIGGIIAVGVWFIRSLQKRADSERESSGAQIDRVLAENRNLQESNKTLRETNTSQQKTIGTLNRTVMHLTTINSDLTTQLEQTRIRLMRAGVDAS